MFVKECIITINGKSCIKSHIFSTIKKNIIKNIKNNKDKIWGYCFFRFIEFVVYDFVSNYNENKKLIINNDIIHLISY